MINHSDDRNNYGDIFIATKRAVARMIKTLAMKVLDGSNNSYCGYDHNGCMRYGTAHYLNLGTGAEEK